MDNWVMQSNFGRLAAATGFKEVMAPIQVFSSAVTVNVGVEHC